MDFAPHKLECADLRKNFSVNEPAGRMLDTSQPTHARDRVKLRSVPASGRERRRRPRAALLRHHLGGGRHQRRTKPVISLECPSAFRIGFGSALPRTLWCACREGARTRLLAVPIAVSVTAIFTVPVASTASDSQVRTRATRWKTNVRARVRSALRPCG